MENGTSIIIILKLFRSFQFIHVSNFYTAHLTCMMLGDLQIIPYNIEKYIVKNRIKTKLKFEQLTS